MRKTNIEGKKFGRLKYICDIENSKGRRKAKWVCDCGNEVSAFVQNVIRGLTSSCGCFHKEVIVKSKTKHGLCQHGLYLIFKAMHNRCSRSSDFSYKNYGGRGIVVCDAWQDFSTFYNWCISSSWQKGLQIDRIDNNGNYSPTNCRIVTQLQNNRNTRKNHFIEYNGERKTISEWASVFNLKVGTLQSRITKYKWHPNRAFTEPIYFKHSVTQ